MPHDDTAPGPIESLPSASTVHRRISVLVREERLLRRLLQLIVDREQLGKRTADSPPEEWARG
jgi:hypothetical protein